MNLIRSTQVENSSSATCGMILINEISARVKFKFLLVGARKGYPKPQIDSFAPNELHILQVILRLLKMLKHSVQAWLIRRPANIKESNKNDKIYVERFTAVYNVLFCAYTLC